MRIFYLSRAFPPESTSGGALIRSHTVELLRRAGFEVTVVTPTRSSERVGQSEGVLRIPLSYALKPAAVFERLGIYEDYLDPWVRVALQVLMPRLSRGDVAFATSGGELGMIRLASLLKRATGCFSVVNFHDPLDYSLVFGKRIDSKFHVGRERQEAAYVGNADLVITTSQTNMLSLKAKYPAMAERIVNNYFGYMEEATLLPRIASPDLRIAYGGCFSELQAPELLAQAAADLPGARLSFIGGGADYQPLRPYADRVSIVPFTPHDEFMQMLLTEVDVGFVSLASDYLGACVPSKIYEYVNLGLPILGALPAGDAFDLVNEKGWGIVVRYDDIEGLREAVVRMKDASVRETFSAAILRDRPSWSMESRIGEVVEWLNALA